MLHIKAIVIISSALMSVTMAQAPKDRLKETAAAFERLATCRRAASWRVKAELLKSMTPETCSALLRALEIDERFREPFRRGRVYEILAAPVCGQGTRFWAIVVRDVASGDQEIAGAAHMHLLHSTPQELISLLADTFIHDPRFRYQNVRHMVSDLFIHIDAASFPEAVDALLIGVIDDDHIVQSNCALAIAKGPARIQQRALEVLAPIWRTHRDRASYSVQRAIRCASLFGPTLDAYADELKRLFVDKEVHVQIRTAAGGALCHAGRIKLALDLFEQLDISGKVALIRELKNVYAQRRDFLKAEPEQAARLRRIILVSLHSREGKLRQAAFSSLIVAFREAFLLKDDAGKWDLNPEVRATLEDMVANDPDEELVEQARNLLDPNQTLGWLLNAAEEREQHEKRFNQKHE